MAGDAGGRAQVGDDDGSGEFGIGFDIALKWIWPLLNMPNLKLSHMLPIQALLLVTFILPTISAAVDIRLDLTHVDAAGNFTKFELIQRMALRSKTRAMRLLSPATDPISATDTQVFSGEVEYLIELAIGTPPLSFPAILDTGSNLIWTQCKPCNQCFPQPTPLFDPSKSSTFSMLSCTSNLCQALPSNQSSCGQEQECIYVYGYGDNSSTAGVLSSETFTLGSQNKVAVPNLGFGCGRLQPDGFDNVSGLVGFGRGNLSLVSQLGVTKFAYCFTSINESMSSTLLFGSAADLNSTMNDQIQSTSLITNPSYPSFYYLPLNGITVGTTRLPIPTSAFALKDDGTGGLIIDSGTSITQISSDAYQELKTEFLSQINLPAVNGSSFDYDLCFALPSSGAANEEVPKLVFHFEGADLDLPRENYIFEFESEDKGVMCLAMAELSDDSSASILGNYQQQNMKILYDLENNKLSFVTARCDEL